jgi:primosomal replication protein N
MKPGPSRRLRLPLRPDAEGAVATRLSSNRTELAGQLQERGSLRYTPAGVPVIEFRIAHASEQIEAANPRRVECELACVAIGPLALLLKETSPGMELVVGGFLAARSLKQKTPVLHVTTIEFAEKI